MIFLIIYFFVFKFSWQDYAGSKQDFMRLIIKKGQPLN